MQNTKVVSLRLDLSLLELIAIRRRLISQIKNIKQHFPQQKHRLPGLRRDLKLVRKKIKDFDKTHVNKVNDLANYINQ
jgi:hypothetical protein